MSKDIKIKLSEREWELVEDLKIEIPVAAARAVEILASICNQSPHE